MRILLTLSLAFLMFAAATQLNAEEVTFQDLQKRATRNEITKAIIKIDNKLRFSLAISGEEAVVKIWKNLKTADSNKESYTFSVTPEIRQELQRLELQKELELLKSKADLLERSYRVSIYKKHNVFLGMPYEDALKVFGDDFKDSGPIAEFGTKKLVSESDIVVFKNLMLFDIYDNE